MTEGDLVVVIVLSMFTIIGMYWGIIRHVLAVSGVIVGYILAGQYGHVVAAWLSGLIPNPNLAHGVGFLSVVVLVSAGTSLIASFVRVVAGVMVLGWLDHVLGAVLGLVQGWLIVTAVVMVLVVYPVDPWNEMVRQSVLARWLLRIGEPLTLILPDVFATVIRTFNAFGVVP